MKTHLGQMMEKQRLKDMHNKISALASSYLVLIKEGNKDQAEEAREKAKSEFHKIGPEMAKLANQVKGNAPALVETFLSAVEGIFLSGKTGVDPAKMNAFHQANAAFEKEFP
jgi:hypothetical protein